MLRPSSSRIVLLRPARATRALLVANVIYFAMTWIAGGPEDLAVIVNFGANAGPLVADGEFWRLVVSMFLHGGVLHLLLNGYALFFLGRNLEAFYGPWAFLFLFLVSGVAGSIASATLSTAISVGASGGVFGLLGASIVFAFKHRGVLPKRVTKIMGTMLLPWVAVNILLGSLFPRIDMNAHLGGLVTGAVIAFFVKPEALEEAAGRPGREATRIYAAICLPLLLLSFASAGQNIFRMRGETGALLDPRLAVGEPDRQAAIRRLTEALRENPEDTRLLMLRAQLHMLVGDWLESIRDYQSLLELDPDDATAMNNLAWLLLEEAPEELRNRTEATRLATRAVKLSPDDPYVLGTYATARLRNGDAEEAARHFVRALETKREPAEEATDRYLLALALHRLGRAGAAREAFDRAVRQDPTSRYRFEFEAEAGSGEIQSDPSL